MFAPTSGRLCDYLPKEGDFAAVWRCLDTMNLDDAALYPPSREYLRLGSGQSSFTRPR